MQLIRQLATQLHVRVFGMPVSQPGRGELARQLAHAQRESEAALRAKDALQAVLRGLCFRRSIECASHHAGKLTSAVRPVLLVSPGVRGWLHQAQDVPERPLTRGKTIPSPPTSRHIFGKQSSLGMRLLSYCYRAAVIAVAALPLSIAAQGRVMTPEDLFRIQNVQSVVMSPDGRHAAVEISRQGQPIGGGRPSGDLWLANLTAGSFRMVPAPQQQYLGAFNAVWSPSGDRLSFLTVDDSAAVRLWMWETKSTRARMIAGLDLQMRANDPSFLWLDDRRLVARTWHPAAEKGGAFRDRILKGRRIVERWNQSRAGDSETVSVLESGVLRSPPPDSRVMLVDVVSGASRNILDGRIRRIAVSADGSTLAFFAENPGIPGQPPTSFFEDAEIYDAVNWGRALNVVSITTAQPRAPIADLVDPDYESLKLSRGGKPTIAARLRGTESIAQLIVRNGRWVPVGVGAVPGSGMWLGEDLLVRGSSPGAARRDWLLVGDSGARNLTSGLPAPPTALVPGPRSILLALSEGRIWLINRAGVGRDISGALPRLESLRAVDAGRGTYRATVAGHAVVIRLAGDSAVMTELALQASAQLLGISPAADRVVYAMESDSGTRLLVGTAGDAPGSARLLWRGNHWVAGIRTGTAHAIKYVGRSGQPLTAWLLLPPGKPATGRLPLVVRVYPGIMHSERGTRDFRVLSDFFVHPQLYAALGYAVLLPSMPMADTARALGNLGEGVFPIIDTLVARGVIDSTRIAVVGQSDGGWATLGLIATSARFRSAIASASISNQASLYGTFYGSFRNGDAGHPLVGQVLRMLQMERGYGGMRAPPWEAAERYREASPVFAAGSITTPLMLVHGDLDFIPIQQAEEMFTALYRQEKRAQLVRYYGEGHTPTTKTNVLDLWKRMELWLSETMR